jgi:hypothetical protein
MLKYTMTATALKAFSLSQQTKQGYRFLGNTLGQKKRIQNGLTRPYIERAKQILEKCNKYQVIQSGDRIIEIGTGWVHWESTILRLFYDVKVTLFDVWDNRHFTAYKNYYQQLAKIVDDEFTMDKAQREHVHHILNEIERSESFEEIYERLDFTYVINPKGTLDVFADKTFSLVFSSNVLEHVEKAILPGFTRDFYRILQPGGYSIQQIDLGDHLSYYDPSASVKNYLRYSNKVWKRYFENDVQYFNRVQKPDWMQMFEDAGLELVEEDSANIDLGGLAIDRDYLRFDSQELKCWTLRTVHMRPRA